MRILTLTGEVAKLAACRFVMEAAEGMDFILREAKKSRIQEERYHAMIGDIAEQYLFCNRYWDKEDMKRLCLDQFRRDTAHMDEFKELWREVSQVDLAPSLDGSGTVALGIQSRRFPKKLATVFIDWLFAFGDENGVRWTDPTLEAVA